jgi:hypothetical protein
MGCEGVKNGLAPSLLLLPLSASSFSFSLSLQKHLHAQASSSLVEEAQAAAEETDDSFI